MSDTPEQERIADLEVALLPFARYTRRLRAHLGANYRAPRLLIAGSKWTAQLEAADWDRAAEAMRDREEQ